MDEDSLSIVAEKLASSLAVLRTAAELNQPGLATGVVEEIAEILDANSDEMERRKQEFANVGAVGDLTKVGQVSYASAHQAAFAEAQLSMTLLWFHMDPAGLEEMRHRSGAALQDKLLNRKVINGTGLDPQQIADNWERAKEGILEILAHDWHADFSCIKPKIEREAAAIRKRCTETGQPDSKTENKKESWQKTPENLNVSKLAKMIRINPDKQRSKIDMAREITNGDETKAQSLVRQLRNFPNLTGQDAE